MSAANGPPRVAVTRVPWFTTPPQFPNGGATVYVQPVDDATASRESEEESNDD